MARKDQRSPDQIIKGLQADLAEKERELAEYRQELGLINRQLEKFLAEMANELKLAAVIQRTLVPTEIPSIPGFEFSTKFIASSLSGGDYFDIFELEDKMRFGILSANSTSHGMASLFLSVLLKLTTQIEAKKGMEPAEVLKRMAKEIQTNIQTDGLANVFYSVIDRRDYGLSYSLAGKVNAYLYSYSRDKLVRLDSTQAPIGKTEKPAAKAESISLEPRDKLILASEGVTKVQNLKGDAFGEKRLEETLLRDPRASCHDVRNEVVYQVSRFAEGQDYPQDLSVIVVEVKDKVIKLKR